MKLIYRGTTYDYDPSTTPGQPFKPVRVSGEAYQLCYRKVTYRVDPNAKPSEVPVTQAAYKLTYRGISYLVSK